MSGPPSVLRRPLRLAAGLLADRRRPRLDRLRAQTEPRRFVWAILPHAGRSFAACIAMLPGSIAEAAAVGYLHCRMLDTYEDLEPDPAARRAALRICARRLETTPPAPAPPIRRPVVQDARDRVHLLLVERHELVDRVHAELPAEQRTAVRELVAAMAEAMAWSTATLAEQGGVLTDGEQLSRYCDGVMGLPVRFALRLALGRPLPPEREADARAVGEYVQLANIVRDVEKDLRRGVAYLPELRPFLGPEAAARPEAAVAVAAARRRLLRRALGLAPAYRRLIADLPFPRFSHARAAAVLMQLFTDRFYSGAAARLGLPGWRRPAGGLGLILRAFPAWVSPAAAGRILRRIEEDLAAAAARLT
ncbi:MAG: hypothetical protein D6702_04930 [Planctomycetota bacterium]|nr:MAG: hypothetical protein D6702_04930 [Planctomycetota bacterium]